MHLVVEGRACGACLLVLSVTFFSPIFHNSLENVQVVYYAAMSGYGRPSMCVRLLCAL